MTSAPPCPRSNALLSLGRAEELDRLLLHRGGPDADVVDYAGVVEGSEADVAAAEMRVLGDHDGPGQVVEVDLDGPILAAAFEANLVPHAQAPIHTLGGL